MNIFILDENPVIAAQMHCDRHVCKMIIESAQMLCGAFPNGIAPYKRSYYHHPCSQWTRESSDNYIWHLKLAKSLSKEYTFRYKRTHKCNSVINWCENNIHILEFPSEEITPFAQAMPNQYQCDNAVMAYRNYYNNEKASFAKWNNGRNAPLWWNGV